jgi:transposase InsO family protein
MQEDRKQKIALFRFGVISGILSVKETDKGQRETRITDVVSKEWEIPYSGRSYIGRSTVRDWLRRYEQSGGAIESLFPHDRSDQGTTRCMDEETEAVLIALRKEMPAASLPVLLRVARSRRVLPPGFAASSQSIYRLFKRHGLDEPLVVKEDLRRYEAELPNDLWQSDCLHGPVVVVEGRQRKSFGFAFIDDHSRLVPHGEFYLRENIESFTDALKKALKKRGLPRKLYVDNGPYFRSHNLDFSCASLGISLIHCTAYRPEGKGKIERFNKTIRTQFLSTLPQGISLEDLNEGFGTWIDSSYHLTVHGSTGEKPLERYLRHLHLIRTAPKDLDDYFRLKAERTVDKDRTVSLLGKVYEAPLELIGRKITLLYHPEDPQSIEALYGGKSYGFLVPLNPHINCTIRRRQKITEVVPLKDHPPEAPPSYGGGKLFDKEANDNEL